MLDTLTHDEFAKHLNKMYTISDESNSYEIELVKTEELGQSAKPENRKSFSILFRGKSEESLPQQTYKFNGDGLEDQLIFLVPLGPDEKGFLYEAVFN